MKLTRLIVTGFGLGLLPKAPGTFGTIGGLIFWAILHSVLPHMTLYWALLILMCFIGTHFTQLYERQTKQSDPSEVVIDEWVGIGVTLAFVSLTPLTLVLSFALFRLFDITKPPGVRYFDQNHFNSWGTMLDDVVAGLYAGILLGILTYYEFI